LVSVKVFSADGRGSVGSVLAGLDYIIKSKEAVPDDIMVANLSFGTPVRLHIFQKMVARLVELRVPAVASAGNDASDACTKYPGGMSETFTVSASDVNDQVPRYSNLGACVDMFAPGDRITSAWRNSNLDHATLSGTSQAAAFATGVIALVLEVNSEMSPEQIKAFLQNFAAVDALTGIPSDSPTLNLVLNMAELALT
jgi:subtilisin family serine protease